MFKNLMFDWLVEQNIINEFAMNTKTHTFTNTHIWPPRQIFRLL